MMTARDWPSTAGSRYGQARLSGTARFRGRILLGFLVAFMIAPKIDVIAVLRVEDFVFLGVLPVLVWRYARSRTAIPDFLKWYFAYLGIAVLSAIINTSHLGIFGLVNVARQIQYLIWFVVGAQLAAAIPEKRFERAMGFVAVVLILWAVGEFLEVIPKIGQFTGATGRVTVNTSGPYEISVIVVFLMLFVRKKVLLAGLFFILLASQARITLAAAIVTYLYFNPKHAARIGIPLAMIGLMFLINNPDIFVNSRLAETMSPLQMWQAFLEQIENSPLIANLNDYQYFAYDTLWSQVGQSSQVTDVSFEIRLIRWALIIKSLTEDSLHMLFGWGPGAWGAAVDSHYIRFLGEVGVVGTALFMVFLVRSILSPLPVYSAAVMLLATCSVFIDVMTASKIMSFLWAILGYTYTLSVMKSGQLKPQRNPGSSGQNPRKWEPPTLGRGGPRQQPEIPSAE